MPIRIIPTNSIRAILAYWLKCTCSCQSRVRPSSRLHTMTAATYMVFYLSILNSNIMGDSICPAVNKHAVAIKDEFVKNNILR